ncbi:hypothetical protein [Chryseobacterium sp. W4I1]|uniref:hypothetical protein n=1 Tax=Chryseobacterium sp. W4I1 TaxID=3042293 RepID=UPI0027D90985|nr:hypothetical protein [Chryseobacterium sp. W4I1]
MIKQIKQTLDTYKIIFKEYWENSAQWIEFANAKTIKEWEDSTNKVSLNKDDTFSTAKGPAVGITNDRSGKVLLSTKLFKKTNWYLADRFIHEQVHSIDIISGFSKNL